MFTCAQIEIYIVLLCLPVLRQEYILFCYVYLCPDRNIYCSVMFTCAQIGMSFVPVGLPVHRQKYLLFRKVYLCTDRNIYCSVWFTCAQIGISIVPLGISAGSKIRQLFVSHVVGSNSTGSALNNYLCFEIKHDRFQFFTERVYRKVESICLNHRLINNNIQNTRCRLLRFRGFSFTIALRQKPKGVTHMLQRESLFYAAYA